jgi:protein MpaA
MTRKSSDWIKVRPGFLSPRRREIAFYLSQPLTRGGLDMLILGAFHGDEPESALLARAFLDRVQPGDLKEKRVGIVPVVNPDGLAANLRTTSRGVDLNRNFPTRDWIKANEDTPYYSGAEAASEPETRFILDVLKQYPAKSIISLHTPYTVINYDGPALYLAQSIASVNGYPVVENIGYPTPGSFGTYAGKERQIPTVTLELPEKNLEALYQAIIF